MSHHYSGPDFGFPHGDARLDTHVSDQFVALRHHDDPQFGSWAPRGSLTRGRSEVEV
jgi:hypothetical protein